MSDPLGFLDCGFRIYLEQVLDLASRRAEQAEVFGVESLYTPVSFEANRLKFIETKETRGLALRVIAEGRVGLASSTRLDEPGQLVDEALAVARLGAPVSYQLPGAAVVSWLTLYHPDAAAWEPAAMVQAGREMIETLRRENSELLCDAHLGKSVQGVAILNSQGLVTGYQKTQVNASLTANWIRGTDILNVWEGESSLRLDLRFDRLVEQVAHKVRLAERVARVPTAQMPVIFTPKGVYSTLLAPLEGAFNGKMVLEGASPLSERLGERAFDPCLSILDDPLTEEGVESSPVDDEGVPTRPLPLVEAGVVCSFYYDLHTASLAGVEPTGHGRRGLASLPSPGLSNLVVAPGQTPFTEMLAEVRQGLLVDQTMGAWAGNTLAGEFSGNVHLGYLVESGELVGRVKDTMVSGNVFQALAHLQSVGDEAVWIGGAVRVPHLCFASLGVASKSEGET
ncbi:MAG: TldD/PmbA family protein [Anaerolineae bacterium]